MSSVKLKLTKMLLFVSFGLKYIYYSLILFLGVSESCIICFCLILLAFLFVYLHLFGLNRGLKILFGLFWLPKSSLLERPDHHYPYIEQDPTLLTLNKGGEGGSFDHHQPVLIIINECSSLMTIDNK